MALTPEMGDAVEAHIQRVRTALALWEADRTYFNFTERSVDGDRLFPPDTYRRLREVKALYDPEELFQAMHSISPAG